MGALAELQGVHPVSNRDQLKRATQGAHTKAEARWFAAGSFASRASYDEWLSSLLMAHATLGAPACQNTPLKGYGVVEKARRDALVSDLQAQHVTDDLSQATRSDSWSWGVLYALHGSALGASILLKSGAVQQDWPTRYLEEMRAFAVSGALKVFFQRVNAAPLKTADAIEGANAVFDVLAISK